MEKRIKDLRLSLQLSVDELSLRTLTPAASIYAYEKGSRKVSLEYVQSLLINCAANPIWILSGKGDMFIDEMYDALNHIASTSLRETLANAILTANANNNLDELEQVVTKYDVMARIRTKFVNFNAEQSFWQVLLKGDVEKNTFLYLLGKTLSTFDKYAINQEITVTDAKQKLKSMVEDYELSLFKEKILRGITKSDQETSIHWIETSLTDLECYVILLNIPQILLIIQEMINYLNKKAISTAK